MFGKNIRELREDRGLSQKQLAEKIGVTQGAIYFWEKEINEPTAGCLIRLAEFFSVSVDELLSFDANTKGKDVGSAVEILGLFNRLSKDKQQLLIETAKAFLEK